MPYGATAGIDAAGIYFFLLTNQSLIDNLKPPSERRPPTMPLSGTLTKANIIDAVAEINCYTREKSIETVQGALDEFQDGFDGFN